MASSSSNDEQRVDSITSFTSRQAFKYMKRKRVGLLPTANNRSMIPAESIKALCPAAWPIV